MQSKLSGSEVPQNDTTWNDTYIKYPCESLLCILTKSQATGMAIED